MNKRTELTLLFNIAHSYYIDNLTQNQIAEREHISRSQISRLLDKAKKLGIVNITVALPEDPDIYELSESVANLLDLKEVVIAPVDRDVTDPLAISEAIAQTAANYIPKALRGCRTVGLGWGRTMYNMSLNLAYRNYGDDRLYVPLVGVSGASNRYLQINTIVDRVAERHRARGYFVNLPAIRETAEFTNRVDAKRMATLQEHWDNLDAAVLGLGMAPDDSGLFMEEVNMQISNQIVESKTEGDILSYFFYRDGTIFDFGARYHHIAYDIHKLPTLKKVICLAGGANKMSSIEAAAKLGFFNILVTDSNTAKMFYDQLRSGGGRI